MIRILYLALILCTTFAMGSEKVFFIGNSYTYCNSLPGMLDKLGKGAFETDSYTVGAGSLQHYRHVDPNAKLSRT